MAARPCMSFSKAPSNNPRKYTIGLSRPFPHLACPSPQVRTELLPVMSALLPQCHARQLANVAWALAKLNLPDQVRRSHP
jgi:hypothetical protein